MHGYAAGNCEHCAGVEATRAEVGKDAAAAQVEADKCQAQKDDVEADLAEAMPVLAEVRPVARLLLDWTSLEFEPEESLGIFCAMRGQILKACAVVVKQAVKALDTIKPAEINEIRALAKPPAGKDVYLFLVVCVESAVG